MINLEELVVRKLKTAQHLLCTAESCTGGLISNLITNVSGASEVFWGAWTVYDNSAKVELGVPAHLIQHNGAVSPEVAKALAESGITKMQNILARTPSQSLMKARGFACLATTGIAGPLGGTREKPVGLCYIALAISGQTTLIEKINTDPSLSREKIKSEFAVKALELIRSHI